MKIANFKTYGTSAIVLGALGALALTSQASTSATPASLDARTAAVSRWLGVTGLHDQGWRLVTDAVGARYQTHLSGVGVVEIDAATNEVDEVIYDSNLDSLPGATVDDSRAQATATTFARARYSGFDGLVSRGATLVDHGVFREYRAVWQARRGNAWLPSQVTVGVNAATGEVAYYWSRRVAVTVSTDPAISAASARHSAEAIAPGLTITAGPDLEVTVSDGHQQVVWVTELTHQYTSGVHVSDHRVVWTDARTGVSQIVARG